MITSKTTLTTPMIIPNSSQPVAHGSVECRNMLAYITVCSSTCLVASHRCPLFRGYPNLHRRRGCLEAPVPFLLRPLLRSPPSSSYSCDVSWASRPLPSRPRGSHRAILLSVWLLSSGLGLGLCRVLHPERVVAPFLSASPYRGPDLWAEKRTAAHSVRSAEQEHQPRVCARCRPILPPPRMMQLSGPLNCVSDAGVFWFLTPDAAATAEHSPAAPWGS